MIPLSVGAQSTGTSAQIAALLAQIAQLQAQIQNLQGATSTQAQSPAQSASTSSYTGVCPSLTRNLSQGASGADVANLQAFLAGQGIFKGSVTAYFGPLTATAVGQWQESHGVVTGGTASSTGFGIVGPKTRAAIAVSCGVVSGPTQCIPTQPPLTLCSTTWQPVKDANGCTMYYQCVISLPTGGSSSAATTTSGGSCPFVQKPTCSGTISPFTTNSNGCVTAYVCTVQ